jgi:hypothetical protein
MPDYRGTGLGRDLMVHILTHAKEIGFTESAIEAQLTVIPFYARLGYVAEGPEYDDGSGILHRVMRLALDDWPGNAAPRVEGIAVDRKAAQPHLRKQGLRPRPELAQRSNKTRVSGAKPLHLRHFGPHARVCPVDAYLSRS